MGTVVVTAVKIIDDETVVISPRSVKGPLPAEAPPTFSTAVPLTARQRITTDPPEGMVTPRSMMISSPGSSKSAPVPYAPEPRAEPGVATPLEEKTEAPWPCTIGRRKEVRSTGASAAQNGPGAVNALGSLKDTVTVKLQLAVLPEPSLAT